MPAQPAYEKAPLKNLDEWEEDLLRRYPDPEAIAQHKATEAYRNYEEPQRDTVKEFYQLNHEFQTYAFVQEKRNNFLNGQWWAILSLWAVPIQTR